MDYAYFDRLIRLYLLIYQSYLEQLRDILDQWLNFNIVRSV